MLRGKCLDRSLLNKLIEVDDIDSLDGKDDTSSGISFSLGENFGAIGFCVEFQVGKDDLEGRTRFSDLIECGANFLIETSSLFCCQVPASRVFHDLSCSLNYIIEAVFFERKSDQLLKGK